jgi:hypothetical protein
MRPVFKTQFRIEPNDGRTINTVADEVMSTVTEWVESHYTRRRREPPPPEFVPEITRDRNVPYQIKGAALQCGAFHRATYWAHPANNESAYFWCSQSDLAFAEERLDFRFVLGIEAEDPSALPTGLQAARPTLMPHLIGNPHWRCLTGSTELPMFPRELTVYDVEEFCEESVLAEDRKLPLAVMSKVPDSRSRYPVMPKTLAERLSGAAKVILIRDDLALQVLNQYLGPNLELHPNAVRIYHPGASANDDPLTHWTFFGRTIAEKPIPYMEFGNMLFAKLADRGVITVSDPPALNAFRRLQAEERRNRSSRRSREVQDAEKLYYEAEERAEHLQAQLATLEAQLRERDDTIRGLEHQIDGLNQNVIDLSRGLNTGLVENAEATGPAVEGESVSEIVRSAAERCAHLEFLSSAFDSADATPEAYKFPESVRAHLEALEELGAVRAESKELGMALREWFKAKGMDYRGRISQTSEHTYKQDYTFAWQGEKVLFGEHFTIGAKSANTCLSIHFSTRLCDDRIVVAHVGRHLRNTMT